MKKGTINLSGNQIIEAGSHDAIFEKSAVYIKLYDFETEVEEEQPEILDDTLPETEPEKPKKTEKKEKAKKETEPVKEPVKEVAKEPVKETVKELEVQAEPKDELSKFKKGEYDKVDISELQVGDKAIWVASESWQPDFPDYLVEVVGFKNGGVEVASANLPEVLVVGDEDDPAANDHIFYKLNVKL